MECEHSFGEIRRKECLKIEESGEKQRKSGRASILLERSEEKNAQRDKNPGKNRGNEGMRAFFWRDPKKGMPEEDQEKINPEKSVEIQKGYGGR